MNIVKTNSVTPGQEAEIRELETKSFAEEHLENRAFLSNDLNLDRSLPCFYLGYEGKTLTAFLTTFFPTREDGEINAFTHPDYRRQGRFTSLLQEAFRDLRDAGIGRAVFAVEPNSTSGMASLRSFPAVEWLRAEYRMVGEEENVPPMAEGRTVRPLEAATKTDYLAISEKAFAEEEEGETLADAIIESQTRQGFLLYDRGEAVGVFDFELDGERIFLFGVAVKEECRNRGYGREIVRYALREGRRLQKPVVLDVDSENPPALHLYRNCGFQTTFQVDYYACPLA